MSLEAGEKYTVTAKDTFKINTFPAGVAGGGRKKYTVTTQNLADSVHF
jgi:hypothetical protein